MNGTKTPKPLFLIKHSPLKKNWNLAKTTKFGKWSLDTGFLQDGHLSKTTTFECSQEWSSYTGLTVYTKCSLLLLFIPRFDHSVRWKHPIDRLRSCTVKFDSCCYSSKKKRKEWDKKKEKSPRHGRTVSWNTALSVSWNQAITSSKSTIEKILEKDVNYVRS